MSKTCNRKDVIKFTDYDVLGFDMDFTLARYELVPFFNLTYGCVCKTLVEKKNYDASIFHGLDEDKTIIYSSLIADCVKGNLLKLGDDGSIIRASHGTKRMSDEEISAVYGEQKLFPYFEQFKNGKRDPEKKWLFFENFFDIPGLVAFAKIVDHLSEQTDKPAPDSFLPICHDVSEVLRNMYDPAQFAKDGGYYFPCMKATPDKYIDRISDKVKSWLKELRKDGRKVFLMTSSYPDFTEHIMKTMIGDDWRTYFDLSLYGAQKPRFFTEAAPFLRVENSQVMEKVSKLEAGKEYCNGNLNDLTTFLKELTGKDDPKVIYFGDNMFADAWPSTSLAGWDSVLILEEMDAEGYAVTDGTVPGHEDELEDPDVVPAKGKRRYEHSSLITEEEIELMVSSFWGSVFNDSGKDDDKKAMNTCYGSLIAQFATICVPSIEYLSGVPVDHEFVTFSSEPGNARGFHPGRPRSLRT